MSNHPRAEISAVIALLIGSIPVRAQPFRREIETIPVLISGSPVRQPFAGGINAPIHQFVDIDGDGDLDLFIFDNDQHVDFYKNEGTKHLPDFKLRPGQIPLPPFQTYFLFADLNGDGRIDLVTDDSLSGVRYYRNTGTVQNPDFVLDAPRMLDSAGNPLFAGFSSIPAFVDIDGDSLLDFLSTNTADGSINFYKNIGTRAAPLFRFVTSSFQNITIIGDTCFSLQAPVQEGHGAAAYCFADIDGNGTEDMFDGDLFSHGVFFIRNIGTPVQPQLQCTSNRYPPDGSLVTFGFNQTSFVDIDGDGDLDLFAGVLNDMRRNGFWFYENIGTRTNPAFQFRTKEYLSMIDVGENAHPALVDLDHDGDLDLMVGSLDGQLWYFRNDGTPAQPSFVLADTQFAGIAGGFTYAPAFADIDADSDKDLFVGQFNGHIKFYRNTGTATTPVFSPEPSPVDTISAGQNAVPALVDIDGDGDFDLFVGKGNGRISYYQNTGSAQDFIPVLVTSAFAGVNVGQDAKPIFYDIDHDGDPDLFVGSSSGSIYYYENTGTAASPQFVFRTDRFAGTDAMKESALAFGDIDNDGDPDLFVGTSKGGLHFYRNDLIHTGVHQAGVIPLTVELEQNYPNPFNPQTRIRYSVAGSTHVGLKVFDLSGREVATLVDGFRPAGDYAVTWDAVDFPSGVYYYRLVSGRFYGVRKMVLLH